MPEADPAVVVIAKKTTAMTWLREFNLFDPATWSTAPDESCTGTIVSRYYVLTAAHCVFEIDKKTGRYSKQLSAKQYVVIAGRDRLSKPGGSEIAVTRFVPNPGFDGSLGSGDFALIELDTQVPVSARPLPLAPSGWTLQDGAEPLAYGYGFVGVTYRAKDLARPDALQEWTTFTPDRALQSDVVRRLRDGSYRYNSSRDCGQSYCMDHVGPSAIQFGDSGGPWVTNLSNRFIVGVGSAIGGAQLASRTTLAWDTATVAKMSSTVHEWIVSTAAIGTTSPNTIYRNRDTSEAFMMGTDGFARSIPTGGDFLCFQSQGHPVVNRETFAMAQIPKLNQTATCNAGVQPTHLSGVQTDGNLRCFVQAGDLHDEFFGPGSCGTNIRVGGVLYGHLGSEFTPVSSNTTGTGSAIDPYVIVTTVNAGDTGVSLVQTDTWALGATVYTTSVAIHNQGAQGVDFELYRSGDCYVADNDHGYGRITSGSVSCENGDRTRAITWATATEGVSLYEDHFATNYDRVRAGGVLPNTALSDSYVDNGMSMRWAGPLVSGASAEYLSTLQLF